jgi:hypothetical protein
MSISDITPHFAQSVRPSSIKVTTDRGRVSRWLRMAPILTPEDVVSRIAAEFLIEAAATGTAASGTIPAADPSPAEGAGATEVDKSLRGTAAVAVRVRLPARVSRAPSPDLEVIRAPEPISSAASCTILRYRR